MPEAFPATYVGPPKTRQTSCGSYPLTVGFDSRKDFVWANSIVFGPEMMEAIGSPSSQITDASASCALVSCETGVASFSTS